MVYTKSAVDSATRLEIFSAKYWNRTVSTVLFQRFARKRNHYEAARQNVQFTLELVAASNQAIDFCK